MVASTKKLQGNNSENTDIVVKGFMAFGRRCGSAALTLTIRIMSATVEEEYQFVLNGMTIPHLGLGHI